jgi:hypothetical protein
LEKRKEKKERDILRIFPHDSLKKRGIFREKNKKNCKFHHF